MDEAGRMNQEVDFSDEPSVVFIEETTTTKDDNRRRANELERDQFVQCVQIGRLSCNKKSL